MLSRRRLMQLGGLVVIDRLLPAWAWSQAPRAVAVPVRYPKQAPYESLYGLVDPANDTEFAFEKQAFQIDSHLKRLLETHSLPLASDFRGVSPLPTRYASVAEGVSKAEFSGSEASFASFEADLKRWLDSLGVVRNARFHVLANDLVRYEITGENQYRVGVWKQEWSGDRLRGFAPVEETLTSAREPLFRDITGHAFGGVDSFHQQLRRGVPYWRTRLDSATGIDLQGSNGIAVGDIDGDGWDEIYICQPAGLPNRLYKNRGNGEMQDITEQSGVGVLDNTACALFADFRNIGRQDLVVMRTVGPLLFLNQGGGRFLAQPDKFRFQSVPQGTFTGMAAADFDRDGRLDLYTCCYLYLQNEDQYRYPVPYYDSQNGPPNFLFRNQLDADGNGGFDDVTEITGMSHNNNRYSFAASWCDYDGDGWPDLYVANDFGRNNLYRNDHGRFRDVAAEAGVESLGANMSASWFDYDGDGLPDLYVSGMWSAPGQRVVAHQHLEPQAAYWRQAKGNSLYRNRGDGTFEETGASEGVEMGRWAWSSDGIDFDNDGTPEIFIVTGMETNTLEIDLESFFWRHVVAQSPRTVKPEPAYENGWNAINQLLHEKYGLNERERNLFYVRLNGRYYDFSGVSGLSYAEDSRAFAVTDLDGDGNLDLLLKSRLGPQVRAFQNNCTAGRKAVAIRLVGVQSNRDAIGARVEADGAVKFVQAGSGFFSQHTKQLLFGLGQVKRVQTLRIRWPSGAEQQFHDLAAGFRYDIEEGSDRVRATAFLAPRVIPGSELTGDNEPRFENTWLIEPVPLPESQSGPAFLTVAEPISEKRTALYALLRRYLFDYWSADLALPIWFLVDEQSRAHKIYFSAPDPDDLKLLREPNRMRLALPFEGRYYENPVRSFYVLGVAYLLAGFPDQALLYLERAPQDNYKVVLAIGQIHLEAKRTQMARPYLEKTLQLNPQSASGWNNMGGVELLEGDTHKALESFLKALELEPKLQAALANAGNAYAKLGDAASAETMYRRALENDRDDGAAAGQLGLVLAQQGKGGEALRWFERAIASRPDDAEAINNLGVLYVQMGRSSDAIVTFQHGISVAPDNESLYLNLARVYVRQGNRDKAREVMKSLLTRKPDSQIAERAIRELDTR